MTEFPHKPMPLHGDILDHAAKCSRFTMENEYEAEVMAGLVEEVKRLRAGICRCVEKWRRDADYLDEFADSKKRISAECRRELAAELERTLEGKSDDKT